MLKFLTAALITVVLAFSSCKQAHTKTEIEVAMQKFDSLLQTWDSEQISQMFATDGEFVAVAKGRDSIKKFFSDSLSPGKMILFKSYTRSIELIVDSAVQKGMYISSGVREKDTSSIKGNYVVNWKFIPKNGWKIKRISLKPI